MKRKVLVFSLVAIASLMLLFFIISIILGIFVSGMEGNTGNIDNYCEITNKVLYSRKDQSLVIKKARKNLFEIKYDSLISLAKCGSFVAFNRGANNEFRLCKILDGVITELPISNHDSLLANGNWTRICGSRSPNRDSVEILVR